MTRNSNTTITIPDVTHKTYSQSIRYDKKRKSKSNTFTSSQQQTVVRFLGSGTLPSNSKSDANGKLQLKGRICYRCGKGKHQLDQKCAAIDANATNVVRKDTMQ